MNLNTEKQIEFIKQTVKQAFWACEDAHDLIFKEDDKNKANNELLSAAFINQATSLMSSCKSLYFSNYSELENNDLEDVFKYFDIFVHEILTNIKTNHSHQWSDIEFNAFKKHLSYFISLD